jgi:hypothetical protein
MATYKNVNTDYTLTCNNGNGIFTVNAQTLFTGNVTYTIPSVSTSAFITVAANNTGAITDAGLLAQTGPSSFAGFRFDTTANAWQVSSNVYANGAPVSSYANLGGVAFGSNTQIQYNSNGSLAGSPGLTFNAISNAVSMSGSLTVGGAEVLSNIGTAPTAVANSVAIYNNAPGSGQTGLYVTGNTIATDEVISATRAKLYSIIF